MDSHADHALEAELKRLAWLERCRRRRRKETFRAFGDAGVVITGAGGPNAARNLKLWDEVVAERGDPSP